MESSPVGRLPRELRDMIWKLVVPQRGKLVLEIEEDGNIHLVSASPQQNVLALPSVCKQLRLEPLSLFYARNAFVLRTWAFHAVVVRRPRHATRQKPWHAFEAKQVVWTSALMRWFVCVGLGGVGNIRDFELDLGQLDLSRPME